MKKTIIITVLLLALLSLATSAFAAAVPNYGTDLSYTTKFTAISNTTATTLGTTVQLGAPYRDVTCLLTNPTGTAPDSTLFTVKGGIDSSNLVSVNSLSTSTYPTLFSVGSSTMPKIDFLRIDLTSGTMPGGTLRVDCRASH